MLVLLIEEIYDIAIKIGRIVVIYIYIYIYISSFIKIGSAIQKLIEGDSHTDSKISYKPSFILNEIYNNSRQKKGEDVQL
jgi:hypothetical protein